MDAGYPLCTKSSDATMVNNIGSEMMLQEDNPVKNVNQVSVQVM